MVEFNSSLINSLNSRIYWIATKKVCDTKLDELIEAKGRQEGCIEIMDHLTRIMWDSEEGVREIQQRRLESGEISSAGQSTVSLVGHNYQALVSYCLEINRLVGNLPSDIKIALRPSRHRVIQEYAVIEVTGGETQKPDVDILVYKEEEGSPIVICSCKTSLRERAGQTYRWKLLMDMALCTCEHDPTCPLNKYELHYNLDRDIYVSLITGDFYDERENAQQRGMFTFFDYIYVSRPIEEFGNVKRLHQIVDDLCQLYE